jgi:hypothetical protein
MEFVSEVIVRDSEKSRNLGLEELQSIKNGDDS